MQPPPLEDVQRAIGDRYELLSSVGAGGMGFVYSARHVTLGHVVAVKVLPPEVAASEMRMRRFQQEAGLAASLAHPHSVPVYDFGVRPGITFLIMPFVRGPTLERALAQERPSLDAALRVAREIGAALDHAHGRGVVHRDVKPSNILIDDDSGRALLTDFGVAHVVRVATSPLTAPGVPIGTPDYMAPEQAAGEERLDGRADLYSLAVVTFETLTGTRPAQGSDRATLARALRGARSELPLAVATALVAPLALQPDERPRTVAAWLAAVDRARARPWRRRGAIGTGDLTGSVDSLADMMTPVGEQALRPILGREGGLGSGRTCPVGFAACTAYLKGDEAFRRGDYERAAALYNEVIAGASDFAPAYFGRLLVVAQTNPTETTLREAISGARLHASGLERADSLLLAGYVHLLQRGDGRRALEDFELAARTAPDQPYVHFVLGEFYLFLGALFDQRLASAKVAFDSVLTLDPKFAPAIANSISLAHLAGDDEDVRHLIDLYRTIDTTSVVAELIGIGDTAIFRPADALRLLNAATLERRRFPVLEFLAMQAAQFATPADSALQRVVTQRVMRALERRAATDYERALALRWAVAAHLFAGRADSARARLARAAPGSTAREGDSWIALAHDTGLEPLGDWRRALDRLETWATSPTGSRDATAHWILARAGRDSGGHTAALHRLARPDSAPLPVSLSLDLEARASLAASDTAGALERWDRATRRYPVLSAPFDLVASLWPLRLDHARVAAARGDTAAARRACDSFDALVGYVDQVALPQLERACRLHRLR